MGVVPARWTRDATSIIPHKVLDDLIWEHLRNSCHPPKTNVYGTTASKIIHFISPNRNWSNNCCIIRVLWYLFRVLTYQTHITTLWHIPANEVEGITAVDFSLKEICIQISIPMYRVSKVNQKLLNRVSLEMGTAIYSPRCNHKFFLR